MDAEKGNLPAPVHEGIALNDLPNELIWKILENVPFQSQLNCRLVCTKWKDILEEIRDFDHLCIQIMLQKLA